MHENPVLAAYICGCIIVAFFSLGAWVAHPHRRSWRSFLAACGLILGSWVTIGSVVIIAARAAAYGKGPRP